MIRRFELLLTMLVAYTAMVGATPSFYVQNLATIHQLLHLNLPSQLEPGVDNDTTWTYMNHPLRVCTNRYGDVSHIGYKLFHPDIVQSYPLRPVLDFIERYALEYDLTRQFAYKEIDENQFYVDFRQGNVSLLKHVKPEEPVSIQEEEHCGFVVNCGSGKHQIEVFIPYDYQLLVGTNAVELEQVIERDLERVPFRLIGDELPTRWEKATRYTADDKACVSKGSFLNDLIRSDLYLDKKDNRYHVSTDTSNLVHYVGNLLLTGCAAQPLPLIVTLNKYGYTHTEVSITLQQYLDYCQAEGCELYVGFKQVTADSLSATLFAYHPKLKYNHMLSVEVPVALIERGEGSIRGKLYAYTPLQKISRELFINTQKP